MGTPVFHDARTKICSLMEMFSVASPTFHAFFAQPFVSIKVGITDAISVVAKRRIEANATVIEDDTSFRARVVLCVGWPYHS